MAVVGAGTVTGNENEVTTVVTVVSCVKKPQKLRAVAFVSKFGSLEKY